MNPTSVDKNTGRATPHLHVYGQNAALYLVEGVYQGRVVITTEFASKNETKAYDWVHKEQFLLEVGEIAIMYGYLMGMVQGMDSIVFCHRTQRPAGGVKTLTLRFNKQPEDGSCLIQLKPADSQSVRLKIMPVDFPETASLLYGALQRGLEKSDGVLHQLVKRAAALYSQGADCVERA